ncbi:hypothetical protein B0H13DRAFT_2357669 [Mycena leptocephala]|nr:hypothetical protein B0H13DRAFT_2357669 [Mycena leptocephala]
MKGGSEPPFKCGRAVLEAKAALAIRGLAHRTDVVGDGESGCAPSFVFPSHIASRTITSTRHSSVTMPTQRSRADIEPIDGLPTCVLPDLRDYGRTASQAPTIERVADAWTPGCSPNPTLQPILASFWTPRGSAFPRCRYSSTPELPFVLRIKREFDASDESLMALTVKSKAMPGALPC